MIGIVKYELIQVPRAHTIFALVNLGKGGCMTQNIDVYVAAWVE